MDLIRTVSNLNHTRCITLTPQLVKSSKLLKYRPHRSPGLIRQGTGSRKTNFHKHRQHQLLRAPQAKISRILSRSSSRSLPSSQVGSFAAGSRPESLLGQAKTRDDSDHGRLYGPDDCRLAVRHGTESSEDDKLWSRSLRRRRNESFSAVPCARDKGGSPDAHNSTQNRGGNCY